MAKASHRIRRTSQNVQCVYNLDRRVHAVKSYPVLSPQGASILIYGHENGISIFWRGGRQLKEKIPEPTPPVPNNNSDAVMVLDSDSDDAAPAASSASSAAFVDKPVFEDAPAETPEDGFSEVIQTLDLALGTAVLHVAVLPLTPCAAKDAEPSLLGEQMVFTITCATSDIYVVTMPLTPPSHASKERPQLQTNLLAGNGGRGAFGEVLTPLGGQSKRSDGVAMTLAKKTSTSASGTRSVTTPVLTAHVIVAAHSREASGTLRLWDVTVSGRLSTNSASMSYFDRPIAPFQTEYLPSPLADVAFNPTHPTQLLTVASQQAVRIYDYSLPAIPSEDAADDPYPPQGSWLISLYPPFARSATSAAVRKPVVAAAWIAHGHAILVLLADGQWGIWDLDRTRSGAGGDNSAGPFGRQVSSGIRGAALTTFTVSGQIEGTTPLRNPVAATRKSGEGDFVPMTPHTRRDALASTIMGNVERLVALRGGIEVVQQRAKRSGSAGDESAVLWLGGADYIVAIIPDVAQFWDTLQKWHAGDSGANMFRGPRPAQMLRLSDLSGGLMGERCCGVSAVVRALQAQATASENDDDEDIPTNGLPVEIIVQGESRLVVVHDNKGHPLPGALSTRYQTAARKRTAAEAADSTRAIVVEKCAGVPKTLGFAFDLNNRNNAQAGNRPVAGRSLSRPGLTKSLFEPPSPKNPVAGATPRKKVERSLFSDSANEVSLTQSMMDPQAAEEAMPKDDSENNDRRLAFAGDLDDAANASDDEEAAEDRNVEEEMLDIMEIDRALEAMEERRDSGATKNVFFEDV